jgi:hypothetical protein
MRINTPRHRAVLWAAANLSILAMIPAAVFYYQRQLNAGAYPEDADSIAIPIAGIVAWVLALLAPLNIAMRAALVASARAKRPMDPESPVQLS